MDPDVSTAELIAAGGWDRLAARLCSLEYVQHKADTGRIFDLITEYDAVAAAIPSSHSAAQILPVLAGCLRRNATFNSRHPTAAFQSLWNSCWWYDCADLGAFGEAFVSQPAVTMESATENGPVSQLMDSWRLQRKSISAECSWLRSLLPPRTPIAHHLRLEIPMDSEKGLPAAVQLSGEQLVAWFRDQTDRNRAEPRVWNSLTGERIYDIDLNAFHFPDPSISPDRSMKVSWGGKGGGWGRPVRVFDAMKGNKIASFPTDDDHNVDAAAISADGTLLAAGATGLEFEGYVYIWDLQSKSLRMMLVPRWSVNSLAFSPSGEEILIGSSHGDLEIWDLAKASIRSSWSAHDSWVISAAFSSDGKRVASSSYDGTLRIWDLAAEPSATRFAPHPDDLVEAKFSPDGHRLVTRSSNGTTWLWDGDTGKPITRLYQSSMIVLEGGDARNCLYVGNYMIVSVASGGGVWKSADGYRLADVAERVYLRQSLIFTTDGKRFALWDGWPEETGIITIHDIRTGETLATPVDTNAVEDSSSEGGNFTISMSEDGEIQTYRLPDRVALARIQAHAGATISCAFSADNTLLVSGGADDTVKVWEWETATEIFAADLNAVHRQRRSNNASSKKRDRPRIRKVKFIDDGTIAAAIDHDHIAVWNFRTGEHVRTVSWSGTFEEFPRELPYRAEHRGDEVAIVDSETGKEVAWFRCGRDLGSGLRLIPHPNGRSWAAMLGRRMYHFVLESS